mmetsp:Transcript_31779/g.69474  ORF Transcript_31779/g.69474 Transcript_31779/m.69474 type:complete len:95 (+) Transcript_31779:1105-1389(+)
MLFEMGDNMHAMAPNLSEGNSAQPPRIDTYNNWLGRVPQIGGVLGLIPPKLRLTKLFGHFGAHRAVARPTLRSFWRMRWQRSLWLPKLHRDLSV